MQEKLKTVHDLWYTMPNDPVTEQTTPKEAIHHPTFGNVLKERLDALGVECTVRYGDDYEGETVEEKRPRVDRDIVKFFLHHFVRCD